MRFFRLELKIMQYLIIIIRFIKKKSDVVVNNIRLSKAFWNCAKDSWKCYDSCLIKAQNKKLPAIRLTYNNFSLNNQKSSNSRNRGLWGLGYIDAYSDFPEKDVFFQIFYAPGYGVKYKKNAHRIGQPGLSMAKVSQLIRHIWWSKPR